MSGKCRACHGTEAKPLRVLVTRPEGKAQALARELEACGHAALIEPLLAIEPAPGEPPLDGVQAILLTSAHAVPALTGPAVRLPVFTVGAATAVAARRAGCALVFDAGGDARALGELVAARCRPADGMLLHLSGEQVREGLAKPVVAAGFELRRQVVYRAVPVAALSQPASDAIRNGDLDAVLLFSPRTASTFVALVHQAGLHHEVASLEAICLSAAVAAACQNLRFARVEIASRPELCAILELLDATRRRC